jgi:hypothetical protein
VPASVDIDERREADEQGAPPATDRAADASAACASMSAAIPHGDRRTGTRR